MKPNVPSPIAVKLEHISKKFTIHHERNRSFQEVLVNLFRRNGSREEFWALKDVSFAIAAGETVGIIGENGSGKSTTLKLISGVLKPTEGNVAVEGKVSALLELGAGFHPDLSGRDNIFLNASLLGFSRREMLEKLPPIVKFSELGHFIDVPLKHYSSGMTVRLGFAIAIHVDFDILITDEILAVGDQAFQKKCFAAIRHFQKQGKTIIIVSHDLEAVRSMCGRVLLLNRGRLVADADPSTAIPLYLELLSGREAVLFPPANSTPEPTAREETVIDRPPPPVEITGLELLDGEGRPARRFRSRSAMAVLFSYRTRKAKLEPTFSLSIHRADGTFIYGTSSGPVKGASPEGTEELSCILELPLLEGEYLVSAAAGDAASQEVYHRWEVPCQFEVLGDHSSLQMQGLVYIPCRWEASHSAGESWLGKVLTPLIKRQ